MHGHTNIKFRNFSLEMIFSSVVIQGHIYIYIYYRPMFWNTYITRTEIYTLYLLKYVYIYMCVYICIYIYYAIKIYMFYEFK